MANKNCLVCLNSFYVRPSLIDSQKYCSNECACKGKKKQVSLVCVGCGDNFSLKPSKAKSAKYCSKKCKDDARRHDREDRQCLSCGATFEAVVGGREESKYCSIDCYHSKRLEKKQKNTHPCHKCGISVYRSPEHAKRHEHIFCSSKCFSEHYSGETNHAWQGGKVEVECKMCAEKFMVDPRSTRKYCSRECATNALKGRRINHVDLNCRHCGVEFSLPKKTAESSGRKYCGRDCFLSATKAVKVQRECAECGSLFDMPAAQLKHKHGKYCSKQCKHKGHAKAVSGEGSGRYIHGECISSYSVYFPAFLRSAIRSRDGDRCRICGLHGDNHDTKLHVHHINYDKSDDRLSNLITMCKYCHGTMHGSLEARAKCEKELLHLLSESNPQMSLFITLKPGTTITSLTAS